LKAIGRVPARANDDPWVASTGFAALRPTRVNSRFLELALSADSFISRIQANSVGVSYPGIDASKLVRFQLAVPSEREQEKIVAFLDKETSQIDILILKKEQLIEKLLERRQALITQVVTKGLDPNVPMKDSGVEWLGEVPHAWRVVKLNSLFEIRPGFSFKSEDLDFAGDLQIVRMSDLNSDEKALYLDSTSVKFPESAFISDGDIVLGMTGDFRAILWGRGRAALNQRLAALRAEDLDVAKFAIYPLQIALTIAHDSMFSTTIKNLSLSQLRNIPVPLPPPGERNRILEELDREVGQINMLVEKTRKSIELLKERRQALITQVVTGKIDVRGFAGGNS
jgi:type I restriction enzyme S subunit